ncbi:hypothetical protein F5144DRAFT_119931 [Chaetomium tenue]|uniref:Uncharacterized protein n=1 Tax=Chaetomium tenue TaxID=1854479 RepID=A0ACB7PHM3_9PEZI|nr:hypothetical protein F5144DRAFT_119931 [Chaetomium globosum]
MTAFDCHFLHPVQPFPMPIVHRHARNFPQPLHMAFAHHPASVIHRCTCAFFIGAHGDRLANCIGFQQSGSSLAVLSHLIACRSKRAVVDPTERYHAGDLTHRSAQNRSYPHQENLLSPMPAKFFSALQGSSADCPVYSKAGLGLLLLAATRARCAITIPRRFRFWPRVALQPAVRRISVSTGCGRVSIGPLQPLLWPAPSARHICGSTPCWVTLAGASTFECW